MLKLAVVVFAATRFVTPGGTNSGDCTSAPCGTFTYAISQATAGDVIEASIGTHDNGGAPIVVDKTLTLRGAQFGVDARGRNAVESLLTAPVHLKAADIIVDGFTITCGPCRATPTGPVAAAIEDGFPFYAFQARNNVIRGNWFGIRFGVPAGGQTSMRFNDFIDNDGQVGSIAVYLVGGGGTSTVTIDQNRFRGSVGPQIEVLLWRSPPAGLKITNNAFDLDTVDDGQAVWLANTSGVEISGNRVTGGVQSAFDVFDGSTDISILRNVVMNNPEEAVRIGNDATFATDPNGVVRVEENTFINNARGVHVGPKPQATPEVHFNRFAGNGVDLYTSGANSIDAENNWWGCNDVPVGCPVTSLAAGSSVDLSPWLVMSISASPSSIVPPQTSTVTASFNRNSDGQAVSGFPDTVVSFTATNGSVNPASRQTSGGTASTVFTPSFTIGGGSVIASLEKQSVWVTFSVPPSQPRRRAVRP